MSDQGAEGFLSPFLRRQRVAAARQYVQGRVLDVGCGTGVLAQIVGPEEYVGVEIDPASLAVARSVHPNHRFQASLPHPSEKFDTVVALAVIEHVPDAGTFLKELAEHLSDAPGACIVCTTPHPRVAFVHRVGAAIGLFSKNARDEHKELLDEANLVSAASKASLRVLVYRPFLLGANQLAVLQKERR